MVWEKSQLRTKGANRRPNIRLRYNWCSKSLFLSLSHMDKFLLGKSLVNVRPRPNLWAGWQEAPPTKRRMKALERYVSHLRWVCHLRKGRLPSSITRCDINIAVIITKMYENRVLHANFYVCGWLTWHTCATHHRSLPNILHSIPTEEKHMGACTLNMPWRNTRSPLTSIVDGGSWVCLTRPYQCCRALFDVILCRRRQKRGAPRAEVEARYS